MKRIILWVVVSFAVILIMVKGIALLTFPKVSQNMETFPDVYSEPLQTETSVSPIEIRIGSNVLKIIPKAEYDISGQVVSVKRYYSGLDAKIVPLDIGLCWGDIAKEENLKKIQFEQYLRWLRYRLKDYGAFDMEYLNSHAGNLHAVPADKRIRKLLLSVKKNDKIRLKGYLIDISGNNYSRHSSLSRTDKGDGACEVIYIREIQINKKRY
jgi:hypothetical protein